MEQTEQKHSKKQTSCREQRPSQNDKTTRTKNLFFEKAPTKVRYSRGVQKRKKSSSRVDRWKKEVYLFLFPAQIFLSKSARAPKAVKVCF